MNPHVQVLCMSVASSDRRRLTDPIAVYPHLAPKMAKEFRVFCPAINQGCKYNTRCIKTVNEYDQIKKEVSNSLNFDEIKEEINDAESSIKK